MSTALRVNVKICFFIFFLARLPPQNSRLSNDFIRVRQHIRRNRQPDLLGDFQIDEELELRRLLQPSALLASRR
jgi:hypothetical protein